MSVFQAANRTIFNWTDSHIVEWEKFAELAKYELESQKQTVKALLIVAYSVIIIMSLWKHAGVPCGAEEQEDALSHQPFHCQPGCV